MSKKQLGVYVLKSKEGYLFSLKMDELIKASGMQAIYQVVYTNDQFKAMKIQGTEDFARGVAHSINLILNTSFQTKRIA